MDNSKPKQDSQYLRDMMQGRKKYQRRQWVRDQEIYFGTKYLMNAVVGDHNRITFRCYDPGTDVVVPADYSLSITPFQDMYVSAMFGNGDQRQVRAKANETVVLNFSISTTTDTQVTIYGANRISALNDLSACYIAANNFSMATKLRKLVLGNTTPGYSNPRLVSLTLGENKLLEELDLRNCSNLTGALDLAQCNNLLRLYAEGTRITGATFATNGKVRLIHLPNTINALEMRNLNDLSDFQCSLDYLEQLTLQGGTLDNYGLVSNTIDTLRVIYLYDIDWEVPDTNVLNSLASAYFSLLTGRVYISGSTRLNEISTYEEKWPDLIVTYDPSQLVEQYLATYVDTDGTVFCEIYVDRGSFPPDPVATGVIETPTKEPDQQYSYVYSGWNTLTTIMTASRQIVVEYTTTPRTYTVTWYRHRGVPLASVSASYGSSADYPYSLPTYTDEESSFVYNVFTGWDKSTGFIRDDVDVYATWDRKSPPSSSASLNDLSPAEIYGLATAANASGTPIDLSTYSNIISGSYIDIDMGNDFNFSNVTSQVVCENMIFDGSNCLDTGIKLFDADSPSFTLAIDYEFHDTSSSQTIASCFNSTTSDTSVGGFRVVYGSYPTLTWGGQTSKCGCSYFRNVLVIRHQKGSNQLFIYVSNGNTSSNNDGTSNISTVNGYSDEIYVAQLNATTFISTDQTLVLGADKYTVNNESSYYNYAKCQVYWCKVWYDDLGVTNATELAQWPHEKWRAFYIGKDSNGSLINRYRIANQVQFAKFPFILSKPLSLSYKVNDTASNVGGWPAMHVRTFLNNRIYKAFPIKWRSVLKQVNVVSGAGNMSTNTVSSNDYIFIPSYNEVYGSTDQPYVSEGRLIDFYDSRTARIMFPEVPRILGSTVYGSSSVDPTTVISNNVQKGDIWIRSYNGSNYYLYYIPSDDEDINHYRYKLNTYTVTADDGGLWVRGVYYWTRSPRNNYDNTNHSISADGASASYYQNNYAMAIVPMFAV